MTLLSSKSGSQPETFGALKQKLGKQHSWGFKQHFTSTSTNQDMKTMDKKDKKFLRTCSQETVQSKEENRNVDEKRGFVPSDVNDPTKREFLSQLSKRIFTEQRRQNLFSKLRESGSVQGSSSSSSLLQKIMTPATTEYDSGSLKRRDPRKMFTDSSFYSAKHHPTVADQVEMAHKLSSAMFNEKNKSTKGQQMFLSRVQNAGDEDVDQPIDHDRVPNLKHVMNPEGRMLEWGDVIPEDQLSVEMVAGHETHHNLPNTPDPIAESLNAEAGKGEPSLSRPSTFVSAYRRVFEKNRVVFGAGEPVTKTVESPRLQRKISLNKASPRTGKAIQNVNKNIQTTPNLNNNRNMAQKNIETNIKPINSKDSIVKVCKDKNSLEVIEMKPVTVKIKDPDNPTAPPRKAHFKEDQSTTKPQDSWITGCLNPISPHFLETKKPLDNRTSVSLKVLNNQNIPDNHVADFFSPLDNRPRQSLKRHASFNDKNNLDNQPARPLKWGSNNLNIINRPTDVLKTPYLLSSSNRALHPQNNQNGSNFPNIQSTSMVAKTKALFEATPDKNRNFVPLTKSRTFSSFPTGSSTESADCPLTPSVPQRISSRKVFNTNTNNYTSMNGNINNCGAELSSPPPQRRIPMASFF